MATFYSVNGRLHNAHTFDKEGPSEIMGEIIACMAVWCDDTVCVNFSF